MDYRLEFMIAQLTAYFVAANTSKGKKPSPREFMLSEMMQSKVKPENVEQQIRATFSLFKRS